MRTLLLVSAIFLLSGTAQAHYPSSWKDAKNTAQDEVYKNTKTTTFYCGCPYTSDDDNDGSGKVKLSDCSMQPLSKQKAKANVIEWEHIVPASQMPARQHDCWTKSAQFAKCVSSSGNVTKKRDCCVRVKYQFRAMIFDLHNLAPAIGQVNQYRSNGRYGKVSNGEKWPGCDAKDTGGVKAGASNAFEPPDCMKGNVARVWLYMADMHGVTISAGERTMFEAWDDADPVSPWEKERDKRIAKVQGNSNPFVVSRTPKAAGKCSWE